MRRLTGRIEFRRNFWGRIVLRVEEECSSRWAFWRRTPAWLRYRDANLLDLTKVELRSLVDMRNRIRVPSVSMMGSSPATMPAQPASARVNGRATPIIIPATAQVEAENRSSAG